MSLTNDDFDTIPLAALKNSGIVNNNVRSWNIFMGHTMPAIIEGFSISHIVQNIRDKTEEDKNIKTLSIDVKHRNIRAMSPVITGFSTSKIRPLFPNEARLGNNSYTSRIHSDPIITIEANTRDNKTLTRSVELKDILICEHPIMVNSALCNIVNMSDEECIRIGEDPTRIGSEFILKGNEYILPPTENSTFNNPKAFGNVHYKNELAWVEVLSKPGDDISSSSVQHRIILLTDNRIVVCLQKSPLTDIQIPFYELFRFLGWTSDKKIADRIIHPNGPRPYETKEISKILNNAYAADYSFSHSNEFSDMNNVIDAIISKSSSYSHLDLTDSATLHNVHKKVTNVLDNLFLPMIGSLPSNRHEKAKELAYLIRLCIRTQLGMCEDTDRNDNANKRAHTCGVSAAKTLKQIHSKAHAQPIIRAFVNECKNSSFSNINLAQMYKNAADPNMYTKGLIQGFITGTKSFIKLGTSQLVNRQSARQLARKNIMNTMSSNRNIHLPQSAYKKALNMRQFNTNTTGYIDPIQTPDGPQIGLSKQLSIAASITESSSSELVKSIILGSGDIIPTSDDDYVYQTHTCIRVNGHSIGFVDNPSYTLAKFRYMRRTGKLNPKLSIYETKNPPNIHISSDDGRIVRLVATVSNNYGCEYIRKLENRTNTLDDFKQWITITKEDLDGLENNSITVDSLINKGALAYISGEEQSSVLVSYDYNNLWNNRTNPFKMYSYVDSPIGVYGLPTLSCALANHSPIVRTMYSVRQMQQASGIPSPVWYERVDKVNHIQLLTNDPIVYTKATRLMPANGVNIVIAISLWGGANCEDSIILNRQSIECGLFNTVHMETYYSELDKNEHFGSPDITKTQNIRHNSIYSKLLPSGFIKEGVVVKKHDVIIGKYLKINKTSGEYSYIDKSVVYDHSHDAVVHRVVQTRDQEGKQIVKVVLSVYKIPVTGDKFSQTTGQKGVVSRIMDVSDMPYTEEGIVPDIIFSTLSLPSRMTMNTVIALVIGKLCAINGMTYDGTMFKQHNLEKIRDDLKNSGYPGNGTETMICGKTNRVIEGSILIGPMFYQSLQKYADDTVHAVSHCPTDAMTGQPLRGKASNGAIKIGEMEKDALLANSIGRTMKELFFDHSNAIVRYICRRCGEQAIVNTNESEYNCIICKDAADIVAIDSSVTAKLLDQELNGSNIKPSYELSPYVFDKKI